MQWLANIKPDDIRGITKRFREKDPQTHLSRKQDPVYIMALQSLFARSNQFLDTDMHRLTSPCVSSEAAQVFALKIISLLASAHAVSNTTAYGLTFDSVAHNQVESEILDVGGPKAFADLELETVRCINQHLFQYIEDQADMASDDEDQYRLIAAYCIRLFVVAATQLWTTHNQET